MVEPNGMGGTTTKQVTALGLSKATHEFLTLHYFAIDSAEWWEQILKELIPKARFPGAVVRRAVAVSVFEACHIAPSHRRYPHPLWMDSFSLIADLLLVGVELGGTWDLSKALPLNKLWHSVDFRQVASLVCACYTSFGLFQG